MDTFIMIAVSVSIFFLSYSWFLFIVRNASSEYHFLEILRQPLAPVLCLGSICFLLAHIVSKGQLDAIVYLPLRCPVIFILSSFALLILLKKTASNKKQYLIILAFTLINTLCLPSEINITDNILPPLAEKCALALLWSLFAFLYFTLNGVEGVLSLQTLSIALGVMVLFALGMISSLDGFYSCIDIALFLGLMLFTSFPATLKLSVPDCRIIGFFIGWLGILISIEGAGSCFIILSMYYIYETAFALLKRLSFQDQFKRLVNNTFYARLADTGVSPKNICRFISRLNLVMIILACFQVYAPNNYTLIIFSVFMIFWMIGKVMSTQETNNHLLLTGSLISFLKKSKNNPPIQEKKE